MKNNARALWNIHVDHGLVGSSNCCKVPVKVKGHSSRRSWSCILSLALAAVTFASVPLSANAQLSGRISSASEPVAAGQTQPGQNPIPGLAPAPRPPSPNRKPDTGISPYYPRQAPPPARKYGPPYPFTAEELWQKILKVAALPEGHVTREQVERIFGIKLPLDADAAKVNHSSIYAVTRGVGWYFDMSVMENGKRQSRFTFAWGQARGPNALDYPPSGMCIGMDKVRADITTRGWKLADTSGGRFYIAQNTWEEIPYSDTYKIGQRSMLMVDFSGGSSSDRCMGSIAIFASGDPNFFGK